MVRVLGAVDRKSFKGDATKTCSLRMPKTSLEGSLVHCGGPQPLIGEQVTRPRRSSSAESRRRPRRAYPRGS
jgi:hypothetical protein